jgi:hypothetical protein
MEVHRMTEARGGDAELILPCCGAAEWLASYLGNLSRHKMPSLTNSIPFYRLLLILRLSMRDVMLFTQL